MDRIIAWVTNHGHMDIEWYQPLDTFRCWIGEALEMLMELARENGTQSYILDGAFFPLEEALALHPEYEEALRALVRDRRLLVGPFYTQFDEFLNAGETIVENCLYGDRLSRAFGGGMKAGYLPDNFGHPSQLPQIFRDFGIDNLLFTRGMPDTPQGTKEFRFVATTAASSMASTSPITPPSPSTTTMIPCPTSRRSSPTRNTASPITR